MPNGVDGANTRLPATTHASFGALRDYATFGIWALLAFCALWHFAPFGISRPSEFAPLPYFGCMVWWI